MSTHLQAVEPPRQPIAVESEGASPLQERRQHHPRLQAGERGTDTVMDAAAEGQVVTRRGTVEPHLVGLVELLRIAICRAPKQQNGGSGGYVDAAKTCVVRRMAHQKAKRRLESEGFFDEGRDELWPEAELPLQVGVLSQEPYRVAQQAGGRLAACSEEVLQDDDAVLLAQRAFLNAASNGPEDVAVGVATVWRPVARRSRRMFPRSSPSGC